MSYIAEEADVIVVGGGHAGCEAALASARMGLKTIIFAISLQSEHWRQFKGPSRKRG